jgi:hypothetical protein
MHEWSQREVALPIERALRELERYTANIQYARQLAPYLSSFGRDRVLLVAFERMLARPDAELARICAFLGDPTPEPPRWRELPASNVSSERLRRSPLREGLVSMRPVRVLVDALPARLREWLKSPWRMPDRPDLSETLRARLVERIDPDLARLSAWIGRPLRCDGWREAVLETPLDWSSEEARG